MTLEEFRQTYCYNCGSIQCSGTDDMLEGCPDYREEFREESIRDKAIKLYFQGYSSFEIADRLNISIEMASELIEEEANQDAYGEDY